MGSRITSHRWILLEWQIHAYGEASSELRPLWPITNCHCTSFPGRKIWRNLACVAMLRISCDPTATSRWLIRRAVRRRLRLI